MNEIRALKSPSSQREAGRLAALFVGPLTLAIVLGLGACGGGSAPIPIPGAGGSGGSGTGGSGTGGTGGTGGGGGEGGGGGAAGSSVRAAGEAPVAWAVGPVARSSARPTAAPPTPTPARAAPAGPAARP